MNPTVRFPSWKLSSERPRTGGLGKASAKGTGSCSEELRGSCSTQGLHSREVKAETQRDQDCRLAATGAARPTQSRTQHVTAPLAGPFLGEQHLLYLPPTQSLLATEL